MKEKQKPGKIGSGKRRLLPVIILVLIFLLAALGVFLYVHNLPSKERVSRSDYFGIEEGRTAAVYNQEAANVTPVRLDGCWYLSFSDLYYNICHIFYYDGNHLLYTGPTQTFRTKPGENTYSTGNGVSYQLDYAPCRFAEGYLYIALDYLQLMNYTYYTYEEELDLIWFVDDFGERQTATVQTATVLRSGAGKKNPIVDDLAEGEAVRVLSEEGDWSRVQDARGLTGFAKTEELTAPQTVPALTPDGRPLPIYSNISMDGPVVLGWHQMFSGSGYDELDGILETAQGMNVISPTWFTIASDAGDLQNTGEKKYVTKAHRAGVQVWVLMNNFDIDVDELQVFGSTENRANLIGQMVAAVKDLGADGINVDVEGIASDIGPHYLQFLRELSAVCRVEQLVLSVDNYSPMPHTAFYDRTQQGGIVDYVIVMAYDEHYQGDDDAGSTSTVSWVRQSASRTIEEVPAERVIVGLPFYTRLWCETEAGADAEASRVIDNSDHKLDSKFDRYVLTSTGLNMEGEQKVIQDKKLTLTWLEAEGQYYAEYQEGGSWYRLWVEDERSMEMKLAAAFSYEPAGVAFFKVGHETKEVWATIRAYAR